MESMELNPHSSSSETVASPVTVSQGQVAHSASSFTADSNAVKTISSVSRSTDSAPLSARDSRKSSLLDFSEQIRRLEIEGNKLRAATFSNLGSINGFNNLETGDALEKASSPDLGNLSNFVVDLSADQKCISDLRIQLDTQRRETERLQKQLLGDTSTFGSNNSSSSIANYTATTTSSTTGTNGFGVVSSGGHSYHRNPLSSSLSALGVLQTISNSGNANDIIGGNSSGNASNSILSQHHHDQQHQQLVAHSHSPIKSAFSTIPSGELGQGYPRRMTYDYQPPSHLERSLKESQEQVMELRKKLQEMEESSAQQKKQFRGVVEDLKTKLHDTIMNRDMVLDLRKLEQQAQTSHVTETALAQVRAVLTQWDKTSKRRKQQRQGGDVFHTGLNNEGDSLSLMMNGSEGADSSGGAGGAGDVGSVALLSHVLEKCLQELDHELSMKTFRVTELESDLEELRRRSTEKEKSMVNEYEEMLRKEAEEATKKFSLLDQEHEKNAAVVDASLSQARQQIAALQAQIQDNELSYQQELRTKSSDIRDLEEKLAELKTDNMKSQASWQQKRQALETSMDEIQKELVEVKSEKNELIRTQAAMEVRLEDLQGLATRQESDLETERERVQQQRQREEELRSQVMTLELQMANKMSDVERLERMLEVVKQECSSQVLDKVASAEKLERERYLDQIHSLSSQLGTATEKCNRAALETQTAKSEMENLRTQVHDLTEKLEKARSQMEAALSDKQELTTVLSDRRGDLDRLRREKDHLDQLAEQRADEITELRISLDRVKVQLEEKEKVLATFRQQSSNITQLMEVNTKASDNIREERERLSSALADRSAQLDEVKAAHEALNRKLKTRDKRVRDLEDERLKVTEELAVKNHELETLQTDRDNVLKELKDSRSQVATLTSSKDAIKKELARTRALRNKELSKLQLKLKESEEQYRLSQKALRSKDMVDHKAVRFADKIQKEMTMKRSELDVLTSKLHKQEDMLETLAKEKAMVERDKDSLKKSLAKSLIHTQSLTEELQTVQAQNRQLVQRAAALEEELEQAAARSTASQAQLEKCEQEMTTLRLKHQLELKEAQQSNRSKASSSRSTATGCSYTTGSSLPSIASTVRNKAGRPNSEGSRGGTESVGESVGMLASDDNESDAAGTIKDALQLRDERHRDYAVVGNELKMLLSEMRGLISSGHHAEVEEDRKRHPVTNFSVSDGARNSRTWSSKRSGVKEQDLRQHGLVSPLHVQDLDFNDGASDSEMHAGTERDRSWANKSFSGVADLSDFSAYKEWRPRSCSLTRGHRSSPLSDPDLNHNSSFLSKGGMSDISRLSQSLGSPVRPSLRTATPVPDTQELCRRLEEKINSLTRMGGNLVKENREMADLIHLQGEKLNTVKQSERAAWGKS
ncbi:coiled-coil domain-containing protein 158-like [Plakobranchus ocellatus]|uniref:Coiled-coil domain-containing protein 158-like n=1 Tax=Plakobranchus ocellatus TaxID=259542 RepID=A0AAV3YK19_9GAST|nr:coiled-coil domain-containing protein 158-like [Plakobranchus ocellatus]